MLDLQQLHYFVAVAQTQSIARAAELLHISQSPLSRQMLALEARLGLQLFVRQGQRLRLTPTGREYLADCQALLDKAAALESKARDEAAGRVGSLSIGYVEGALRAGLLRAALLKLQSQAPHVRLHLQAMRTGRQIEALHAGAIDVGLAHRPTGDGELACRPLLIEPYLLAVPAQHPLAAVARPQAAALQEAHFIFLSRSTAPAGHSQMVAACVQAGFEPRLTHEAADPSAALELVACGLGVAIVQASARRRAPAGVLWRPLPKAFVLRLEIHALRRKVATPLVDRFWELLQPLQID